MWNVYPRGGGCGPTLRGGARPGAAARREPRARPGCAGGDAAGVGRRELRPGLKALLPVSTTLEPCEKNCYQIAFNPENAIILLSN